MEQTKTDGNRKGHRDADMTSRSHEDLSACCSEVSDKEGLHSQGFQILVNKNTGHSAKV